MNKIEKFLKKLSKKERQSLEQIMAQIINNRSEGLDIRKLKDRNDIFRVRKGDIRIVYLKQGESIDILSVERRNENTYKL